MGVRPQIETKAKMSLKCRSVNDLAVDSGIGAVLLSVWTFVDQSGPKEPARERPDTCRRQRAVEDSDPLSSPGSGPAGARRLRHQCHRRIGPHLSDERLAASGRAAFEDAAEPSLPSQVSRSRQLLRPGKRARRPGAN